MPSDPHWALNLRAHPDARIHLKRQEQAIHTHVAEGEERASLWKSITERSPVYLVYQKRAAKHREIPVFVLQHPNGSPIETVTISILAVVLFCRDLPQAGPLPETA